MTLYLIRHTHAGAGNHENPDDQLRPLSRKGQKQAEILSETLSKLDIRFHRLFSSPYTRAAETAAPLTPHVRGGRLELLSELTGDDYPELLRVLRSSLRTSDKAVALVGHEPYLGGLTSYLLCGADAHAGVRFRKGTLVRLDGPLKAGRLELHSALTPDLIKQLAGNVQANRKQIPTVKGGAV